MDIGRPPDDPNTCGVAGAQSLTGARNVLLHIAGDLTLEGVYLRDGLSLIVGGDLDAVVAVLDEDGHVAAFVGGVVGLDGGTVGVFSMVITSSLL